MEELFKIIPKDYFATDLKKNTLGSIKLAFLREVTGNLIIRNNYADETTVFRLSNQREVVEIPARKLKSKEKLLGLKICRQFDVVDESVRYNVINSQELLANPNSVLFGDTVTKENEAVGLKSRAIYDWAYSIRDVSQITGTLQHNALSEGGTMWNEEKGELRKSLFQVQYVKPGTLFPHFITVENVSAELFIHLLSCVLYQNNYGAQDSTSGANLRNHLIGVGYSRFEQPVNSYLIAKNWEMEEVKSNNEAEKVEKKDIKYQLKKVDKDSVADVITKTMQDVYGKGFKSGDMLTALMHELHENDAQLKGVYAKAKTDCLTFTNSIGIKVKTTKPKVEKIEKTEDNG
jgi:CRISPR-associated protein Csc2